MTVTIPKDPDATLDYGRDWSDWLNGDVITASQWTVPAGLTQETSSFTDTTTTVWLSGGTDGQTYTITNRIHTELGRTDERSMIIDVDER